MSAVIEGTLNASGKRFALVVSRFNELITRKLMEGAMDCLIRHNADSDRITIYKVPGAFEIPFVARKCAASDAFDAVVCLGAVIRGDTPHFEYIAAEVSKGIASVNMSAQVPVIYGVITSDTIEQAIERAGTKAGNRGWDAALNAVEMADLVPRIR
jgi:6,7-dimethyl-8-ribityllumazine synthase